MEQRRHVFFTVRAWERLRDVVNDGPGNLALQPSSPVADGDVESLGCLCKPGLGAPLGVLLVAEVGLLL